MKNLDKKNAAPFFQKKKKKQATKEAQPKEKVRCKEEKFAGLRQILAQRKGSFTEKIL